MAGEWIKMRTNLWDDPRVCGVADRCECSEAHVIGSIYWLWSMADEHTEDGALHGLSLASINRKTGLPNFAQSMVEIGWLEQTETGVTIPRFSEHNGQSAKKRCVTAKRVAKHKADKPTENTETNAASVSKALPERYLERDKRESKSNKEKINKKENHTEEQIEEIYQAYPKLTGKGRALKSIVLALRKVDTATLLNAVRKFALAKKGADKQYIKNPATWFNDECWSDDPATWESSRAGPSNSPAAKQKRTQQAFDEAERRIRERNETENQPRRLPGLPD